MNFGPALVLVVLLFGSIVAVVELGRHIGLRRRRLDGPPEGIGAMEGAAFALLGLLVAFTFNGAATRFDLRRQQIIDESNALGTAWLRIDLLLPAAQPPIRELFRSYVDQRLAIYHAIPDRDRMRAHLDSATVRQGELWSAAAAAAQQVPNPAVSSLVLMPLNESFDIASARMAAMEIHPPPLIWLLLATLTVICCLLAGFDLSAGERRSWLHILTMSVLLTATLYVIVDFEYPRFGLIRLNPLDHLLVDLRASMR